MCVVSHYFFLNTLSNYFMYKWLPSFHLNPGTCKSVHRNSTAHRVITNNSHPAHAHNIHYRGSTMFTRTLSDGVSLNGNEYLPPACRGVDFCIYITLLLHILFNRFVIKVNVSRNAVMSSHFICVHSVIWNCIPNLITLNSVYVINIKSVHFPLCWFEFWLFIDKLIDFNMCPFYFCQHVYPVLCFILQLLPCFSSHAGSVLVHMKHNACHNAEERNQVQ
jgi:hypothetical protein